MTPHDDHVFSIYIEKNHPACEGHFEGNPLLPGVVTLAYVRCAFKERYPKRQIQSFSKVKFTHNLKPDETLFVHLGDEHTGIFNFRCFDSKENQIAVGNLVAL